MEFKGFLKKAPYEIYNPMFVMNAFEELLIDLKNVKFSVSFLTVLHFSFLTDTHARITTFQQLKGFFLKSMQINPYKEVIVVFS